MRAFNKLILFGVMLTPLIFTGSTFACFTNTFAYFSDVESSTGNTLTAAVWNTEADFLTVSDSKLTGNGEKLHGITLDVSGTQSITIDKIQVLWGIYQDDTSHITEIKIGGQKFFSGSKSVGEVIDGMDYVLEAGSSAKLEFYFDSDVSDLAPFTINIIMGDGSVKSFLTDPKYRSDFPETSLTTAENIQDAQEAPVTVAEESLEAQETAVTEPEYSQDSQEVSTIDTEEESQDAQEAAVTYTEVESQNEQEASTIDKEVESQNEQEAAVTDTESSQDVQEAAVTDTESSQDVQEAAVTDTESSQDVQEAPVTDTESSQDEQEALLDEN